MRERVPIGGLRQLLKAACAEATAAATSSAVAKGTRDSTYSVARLTTSRHVLVRDSTHSPWISSGTRGGWSMVCVFMRILSACQPCCLFALFAAHLQRGRTESARDCEGDAPKLQRLRRRLGVRPWLRSSWVRACSGCARSAI